MGWDGWCRSRWQVVLVLGLVLAYQSKYQFSPVQSITYLDRTVVMLRIVHYIREVL
jgi:hypothetical protein